MNLLRHNLIMPFAATAIAVWAAIAFESAAAQPSRSQSTHATVPVQPPQRMTRKARNEMLAHLYVQLRDAPDEQSAELIAATIEKIWRRSGSDTADLLMERANFALQTQDYELAIKLLTALTSLAPQYAEGWNQLATVHFLREDYTEAVVELRRVLALDPRHYKAIEGLAIILRETGKKQSSLKAMRQVLAIYPQLKSAKQAVEELAREVEGQEM
jgi:tetratricopeptide (TPR) repeat protein